jgi:hypothetical protein
MKNMLHKEVERTSGPSSSTASTTDRLPPLTHDDLVHIVDYELEQGDRKRLAERARSRLDRQRGQGFLIDKGYNPEVRRPPLRRAIENLHRRPAFRMPVRESPTRAVPTSR